MTDGFARRQASSAHNSVIASCQGKARFMSFTMANIAAATKKRRRKDADHLEPYRCRHCQGWHLAGRG